jgi:predicted dehydrogenase
MAKRIRVAVSGLSVSRRMLRFYRESPDTELVLVHDIDAKRAREVAAENPGARACTDFDEVLASDVDMVDVSTPNHIHAPQAIAALGAGKHVLCQKPMAPNVAECRRMCDAARDTGKTLGMLMFLLSQPLNHSLRALVRGGHLGQISSVRQRNAHRILMQRNDRDHWRASRANIGGGSFMQLGVHHLHLVQWLLDDEVVRVTGMAAHRHCRSIEGEDVAAAVGVFRDGPLIAMESSYASVGNELGIYGTAGHFTLSDDALRVEAQAPFDDGVIAYPGPGRRVGDVVEYRAQEWKDDLPVDSPHIQQLAFARAIRDGAPAPVPGEVGLRDVAIIQAIYASSESGCAVDVGVPSTTAAATAG